MADPRPLKLRHLWWMAGGRWEWGTAQLANLLAGAFGKEYQPVNPFKAGAKSAAARAAESREAWAALKAGMRAAAQGRVNTPARTGGRRTPP